MKIGTKYTMHIKKFPDKMEGEDQHLTWSPYMCTIHECTHMLTHTRWETNLTVHIHTSSRRRKFHATEGLMKRSLNPS